jgi:hypothetical protein
MYKAQGPKWRKRDSQKELAPVGSRNVDTDACVSVLSQPF